MSSPIDTSYNAAVDWVTEQQKESSIDDKQTNTSPGIWIMIALFGTLSLGVIVWFWVYRYQMIRNKGLLELIDLESKPVMVINNKGIAEPLR
jgi:hypothetical protein